MWLLLWCLEMYLVIIWPLEYILDISLVMSFHLVPHLPWLVVWGGEQLRHTDWHYVYLYIDNYLIYNITLNILYNKYNMNTKLKCMMLPVIMVIHSSDQYFDCRNFFPKHFYKWRIHITYSPISVPPLSHNLFTSASCHLHIIFSHAHLPTVAMSTLSSIYFIHYNIVCTSS